MTLEMQMTPGQEAARSRSAAWTSAQAQRLGVTPDDILRAVRLGWLPEEVAALSHVRAGDLAGKPPYRSPEAWNT